MKRVVCGALFMCLVGTSASAVMISSFSDTATFVKRAQDIVIGQCVASSKPEGLDDLRLFDVNVLKIIKGVRRCGALKMAAVDVHCFFRGLSPIEPGGTYMLTNDGGQVMGTDFMSRGEFSVVPLPAGFRLEELDGKDPERQVEYVLSRRLDELDRQLASMLDEQTRLKKAIGVRLDEWWESEKPIEIGQVYEATTEGTAPPRLDLRGAKLNWSQHEPGKDGSFSFSEGAENQPYWEFSPCEVHAIEDLAGKPLKAKFYGRFTPGRENTPGREVTLPGWNGMWAVRVACDPEGIPVSFARRTAELG